MLILLYILVKYTLDSKDLLLLFFLLLYLLKPLSIFFISDRTLGFIL
jgi:hypothetical protein